MELIADILLVAGALGAGLYCFVLSRRLKRFTDLEKGVGGAVAVLSSQADELKKSLDSARDASDQSGAVLKELTQRAESVAQRLELMMASMHDLEAQQQSTPEPQQEQASKTEVSTEAETESVEVTAAEDNTVTAADDADDTNDSVEPEKETPAEPPAKKPGGVMFFRHKRAQPEVAT